MPLNDDPMPGDEGGDATGVLSGHRVAFRGRLASMSRRDAARVVRQHGGIALSQPGPSATMIVVGELAPWSQGAELSSRERGAGVQVRGDVEVLDESDFWRRLRYLEPPASAPPAQAGRLYTPAMLAEIVGIPTRHVRRWHRKGWLPGCHQIRRLPFFDFPALATCRTLASLFHRGISARQMDLQLARLSKWASAAQGGPSGLRMLLDGGSLLLRTESGLMDASGQLHLDFEAEDGDNSDGEHAVILTIPEPTLLTQTQAADLLEMAAEMADAGELSAAIDLYHGWLTSVGPDPEICFRVAELLYLTGDLTAARERYYMAVEMDDEFVEARVNLACVLADLGDIDLGIAVLEGALALLPDYADACYHLARLMEDCGRTHDARHHWRHFLELAPESPWAVEARQRLSWAPEPQGVEVPRSDDTP